VTGPGPLDRRILRLGRSGRRFAAAVVVLGTVAALLVAARAAILAGIIADAFDGASPGAVSGALTLLLAVTAGAAVTAWLTEVAAHRAAAGAKSELRLAVLRLAVLRLEVLRRSAAPPERSGVATGELVAAVGPGIDGLDAYFARYVPALALAVAVPAVVLVAMLGADPWAALIVAVTLPLIPVFGALIGAAARPRAARQWRAFADLSAGLLESLRALPTLKVFGREPGRRVADLAERHRTETMGALRVAFLSALVLELAAMISIAVVAVAVALRVLDGGLGLEEALLVLILAPEAYLPLRRVSAEFHAAADGAAATDRLLAELDDPGFARPAGVPVPRPVPIQIRSLTVRRPGRGTVLDGVDLDVAAGEHLAIVGPSGGGKSTLLAALLGFVEPQQGSIVVAGVPLAGTDRRAFLEHVAWVGQDPHLFHGTIADNVRFASPGASDAEVAAALRAAGAGFVEALADGADSPVGERGVLLSAGERARVALARALVRRAPLLVLDEPTAHLDPVAEARVAATLDGLRDGTTVITVAHREALARRADRVVRIERGRVVR